jgi:hypothetical protein
MVSQHDIQGADLYFEPPLTKRAKNRKVYLSTRSGVLMRGITVTSPKRGIQKINVPRVWSLPTDLSMAWLILMRYHT